MKHFYTEEEKAEMMSRLSPDFILDYYGLLPIAKSGRNPFREDRHAGSFKPLRDGSGYIDYAERKVYHVPDLIAAANGFGRADYPMILQIMDELSGCEFFHTKSRRSVKRKHIPNHQECELVGIRIRQVLAVPCGYSTTRPDTDYERDESGGYVLTQAVYYDPWAKLDQRSINDLVKNKCREAYFKCCQIIHSLDHPDPSAEQDQLIWQTLGALRLTPSLLDKAVREDMQKIEDLYERFE